MIITDSIVGLILPGHEESKLLISKQSGDQLPEVLCEGLDNEDNVYCLRTHLQLPADSTRGPHG